MAEHGHGHNRMGHYVHALSGVQTGTLTAPVHEWENPKYSSEILLVLTSSGEPIVIKATSLSEPVFQTISCAA